MFKKVFPGLSILLIMVIVMTIVYNRFQSGHIPGPNLATNSTGNHTSVSQGESYKKSTPKCPSVTTAEYSYTYTTTPDNFTLNCGSTTAHIATGTVSSAGAWPEYTPGQGCDMKGNECSSYPPANTSYDTSYSVPPPYGEEPQNTEKYEDYGVNNFILTEEDPLSTFSIDVDTGSYTLCRRKIQEGYLPTQASVRVEEFVNYFKQDYPLPTKEKENFYVSMEGAPSPFNKDTYMLRIGLQGKEIIGEERLPANLVFLVDVSGSMSSPDKLDLVKESLSLLVDSLGQMDRVSICTYAGRVAEILPPTGVEDREKILSAINDLRSGGSTAMASGIDLAYSLAERNFQPDGINRVIICSDGDANVGTTSYDEILKSIEKQKNRGITLTTTGFGTGNYNDIMMEQLADKGNGNYYYIDGIKEAERIFKEEITGTLQVIAKDVKIQVEFNPKKVKKYRLAGYENRDIPDEQFRDDKKDAGEVGAGHSVTALYEVLLNKDIKEELGIVQLRYKLPDEDTAREYVYPFKSSYVHKNFKEGSNKFRFIVSVVEFAEILRESDYAKGSLEDVLQIAQSAYNQNDEDELELVDLVQKCIEYKRVGYVK